MAHSQLKRSPTDAYIYIYIYINKKPKNGSLTVACTMAKMEIVRYLRKGEANQ
jgi:hypothetical protein